MKIDEFAVKYGLKVQRRTPIRIPEALGKRPFDVENYLSVPGRWGWLCGPCNPANEEFHMVFCSEHPATVRRWRAAKTSCRLAGMTIRTSGDYEGVVYFDPANKRQAETAIRIIRARRKRTLHLNPERIEELRQRMRTLHAARARAKAVA